MLEPTTENSKQDSIGDTAKGMEVYSHFLLTIYDFFVLSFCCPLIWRCSKSQILSLYNKYVSNNHLDIGVGTGYFLDKCDFPSKTPNITLLDLSQNCLDRTEKRIQRYFPKSCLADVYQPFPLENMQFDSVGLNFLLHCLPGSIQEKAKIFTNIKPFMAKGAVIFGATVLGKNMNLNIVAKKLMKLYNAKGIFCNAEDDLEGLRNVLEKHFNNIKISMAGCIAIFSATV